MNSDLCAVYVRVSTNEQNVQTQLDVCRKYAEMMNLSIFKEYSDTGWSGNKSSRPAFDEMLSDMRQFKFKTIIVYKLDRIGRSLRHLVNLFEEFKLRKIEFISATQNINTKTSEGSLLTHLMMVFAEYERALILDRIKEGVARAKKAGKYKGSKGQEINRWQVLRLRNEGKSFRMISKELNAPLSSIHRVFRKVGGGI